MPSVSSKKDVAKSIKTLLVMLQSMRDQQVTITLRNDSIVTGTIVSVDSSMNIELKNALVEPDPFYITVEEQKPTLTSENRQKSNESQCRSTKTSEPQEEILTISEDSKEGYHDNDAKVSCASDDDDDHSDVQEQTLDFLVIKGSRIRHVDIPDEIDLFASTRKEIERIRNRRKPWTKRDIIQPKSQGKID